ncbi:MAG TPA: helix-hairpin-helix domain-containing protein [bacterium]|nr:helix-hairpin-helix domain-containing protein [bacterium]
MELKNWVRMGFAVSLFLVTAILGMYGVRVQGYPGGIRRCPGPERLLKPLPPIRRDQPPPERLVWGRCGSAMFSVEYFKPLPWGLDVNRVPAPIFTLFHGIGPSRAAAVVRERDRNGPFADMDDFCQRCRIDPRAVQMTESWIYAGE